MAAKGGTGWLRLIGMLITRIDSFSLHEIWFDLLCMYVSMYMCMYFSLSSATVFFVPVFLNLL